MLLTRSWFAVIQIAMAGVDAMGMLPWVVIVLPELRGKTTMTLAALWAAELSWLITTALLQKWVSDFRKARSISFALFIASTLLVIWLFVYPSTSLWNPAWFIAMVRNLPSLEYGLQPQAILAATCTYLWLRVNRSTTLNLMVLSLENNLMWRFLCFLTGTEIAKNVAGVQLPIIIAPVFVLCAMLALWLVRTDEQTASAHSSGQHLSPNRLGQILGIFLLVSASAYGAAIIMPLPLSKVVGTLVFTAEVAVIGIQLTVILGIVGAAQAARWLGDKLGFSMESIISGTSISQYDIFQQLRQQLEAEGRDITLSPAVLTFFRYLPALVLMAIITLVFLYIFKPFRRLRPRAVAPEEESYAGAKGIIPGSLDQFRKWAGLIRRYGINQQLLAAISVQNMYANLTRIAAQQDHPRHPATPPDRYLATLMEVFEGCENELQRITDAYMVVHYGETALQPLELKAIQQDYLKIRRYRFD